MNDQNNFTQASGMIDTGSLCDYYIAETFLSNIDWPYNNMKYWRERKPEAKRRYILIDLDISLGNNGWAPADFDVLGRLMGGYGDTNRHVQIFKSLLQNKGFKEYFINRYADLVNTLFTSANVKRHVLETRSAIEEEMPSHFGVWGNNIAGWDHEIFDVAMPYIEDRPAYAMQQVQNVFNLEKIVSIELGVWPPQAGTVQINTITPGPLPWRGDYFDGNPVTISITANPGFKFVKWISESLPLSHPESSTFTLNVYNNNRFTAWFSTSDDPSQVMVFPNPATGVFYFGCLMDSNEIGKIEFINASGQTVLSREGIELHIGLNKLQFDASTLSSGIYIMHIITSNGIKSARLVVI
jgi:hypothetical protein